MNVPQASSSFFEPQVLADPRKYLDDLRSTYPVARVERTTGQDRCILVTSYALVSEATRRTGDFSNLTEHLQMGTEDDPEILATFERSPIRIGLLVTNDAPDHQRYRAVVNKAFAMGSVSRLAHKIEQMLDDLIDQMPQDHCDFFEHMAVPLPLMIIGDLLGVPRSDLPALKRWSDASITLASRRGTRDEFVQAARDFADFREFLLNAVAVRRRVRGDDVISDLIHADVEGSDPLTDMEVAGLALEISVAGNETTRHTLAAGLARLIQNPEQLRILQDNPATIPNAVEEILRLDGALTAQWRVAAKEVELGGVTIPAGSGVLLRFDAANRDPLEFPQPDTFDVTRKNANRHFSFGAPGIHRCLGQMLARQELITALTRLVQRLGDLKIVESGTDLNRWPGLRHRGINALHISYAKAN